MKCDPECPEREECPFDQNPAKCVRNWDVNADAILDRISSVPVTPCEPRRGKKRRQR